jgi:tRNA threonylcarbamoyladenosine biosynthesis protein TsaE
MTHVPKHELPEFARNVRSVLKLLPPQNRATVVYLQGDLGAGKTTFVQTIAKDYGIEDTVPSPTYTLMKSYDIPAGRLPSGQIRRYKKLIHIDAYRLESPKEFAALRAEEFLNEEGTIVFIEWPEKIVGVAPHPDLVLNFSADGLGESARTIEIQTTEGE